jgi:hypothetical protein
MRKLATIVVVAVAVLVGTAVPALAHEGGNDFVCPVFNSKAIEAQGGEAKNPNAFEVGDGVPIFWTLLPGGPDKADHLDVPDQATNMNGAGGVHGVPHSAPGDSDYTAIWNGD